METSIALNTLQALSNTLRSNASGYAAQADALDIAIQQLKGILDTPSADLEAANARIATLQDAVDVANSRLSQPEVMAALDEKPPESNDDPA